MRNAVVARDGRLHIEQVCLTEIAERYGTPCYVYSKAAISENFLAYKAGLENRPHLICYAVKANSNIAVLQLLARLGAGFDIVSVGELERVLRAGGDPSKIVFSGVGKTEFELARALDAGIHCFNVESEPELALLNDVAKSVGKIADVSLRVNPDVDANTHAYISTGLKENKFGIDIARAPEVYRQAADLSNIRVVGVDCHIGSQLTSVGPFVAAVERLLLLIDTLESSGIELRHIDVGGGLGVRYRDESPPSSQIYLEALLRKLADRPQTLVLEPGRSVVANAGALLTRVLYLKHTAFKNFAIVDAAMNDMLRPALYQAWMEIRTVESGVANLHSYDVVGPVCETGDFLGKDRQLAISSGDLLCLYSAGAYGMSMSSNYNSRPRAAEVMVDGENAHLIRQRESIEDLMHGESLLPG